MVGREAAVGPIITAGGHVVEMVAGGWLKSEGRKHGRAGMKGAEQGNGMAVECGNESRALLHGCGCRVAALQPAAAMAEPESC